MRPGAQEFNMRIGKGKEDREKGKRRRRRRRSMRSERPWRAADHVN
jgi:hypothetical protein